MKRESGEYFNSSSSESVFVFATRENIADSQTRLNVSDKDILQYLEIEIQLL
jgi:predicted polyphosphate/ATP-dependent NAD kinase